ncbi:DUF1413 domain-containing protein [Acetitomaculum ruminis]
MIQKVNNLPSGTKYTIKNLFGVEWAMETGTKLNIRKNFFQKC